MPINLNSFGQSVAKGMIDLRAGQMPLSCIVDVTSTLGADGGVGLLPGQAVKIVPAALGGVPRVVEAAAADDIFGFVVYDVKSPKFMRGDRLEVLPMRNGVMYMESSAAINRDVEVMIVATGIRVAAATTGNRIIGRTLDGATAAGKFIRVKVDLPGLPKA